MAGLAALSLCAGAALLGVGWWIDYSDDPQPSDLMVILAGGFARPFYGAELYKKGYAPEVWISRPDPGQEEPLLKSVGISLPFEEDINRKILLARGVPADRIHFYGNRVVSTVDEALALRRAAATRGKRVLVVTSRYHARRSRRILSDVLEGATVRVAATPYESFSRCWWKDQGMARSAILEIFKTVYYCLGGRFLAPESARG